MYEKDQKLNSVINLCKDAFSKFDEIWLVGHKGDHPRPLIDLGIFEGRNQIITLAHVQSSLGINAKYMLKPPKGSDANVEAAHTKLNTDIEKHIKRIVLKEKKVCILAPFSNSKLDEIILKNNAGKNTLITSPTKDCKDFFEIGDKIKSSNLIKSALFTNPKTTDVLIPWINIRDTEITFGSFRKAFNLLDGQGIYMQIDISASGDGTKLIKSENDLKNLFKDKVWRNLASQGRLKVTPEVPNGYSANGSACIIPVDKRKCIVLVDPLSHKPTGLKELGGKENSGVGNDWSVIWPDGVLQKYIDSATAIGKELYKTYGYTGLFGPDYVVGKESKSCLKITEINPRWQGTTLYQTYNALIAHRIPLELVHYIVKLDQDGTLTKKLINYIGNSNTYNKLSVRTKGCFYIKIGSPQQQEVVKRNMNGNFLFKNNHLEGPILGLNDVDIISKKQIIVKNKNTSLLIGVRAPDINEKVGGAKLTPIGYIFGRSEYPVFSANEPKVTIYGKKLYEQVVKSMYSH